MAEPGTITTGGDQQVMSAQRRDARGAAGGDRQQILNRTERQVHGLFSPQGVGLLLGCPVSSISACGSRRPAIIA